MHIWLHLLYAFITSIFSCIGLPSWTANQSDLSHRQALPLIQHARLVSLVQVDRQPSVSQLLRSQCISNENKERIRSIQKGVFDSKQSGRTFKKDFVPIDNNYLLPLVQKYVTPSNMFAKIMPLLSCFDLLSGYESESESDVTYGQVWWPILGIRALHLTHPKCTHTAVNTHTRSSGQPFMLWRPGSSWGFGALLKGTSVVILKVERALFIHSPPPTIPAGPRLELATFGLRVRNSNH